MKSKFKLQSIYGYCRWKHQYPPDSFTVVGLQKYYVGHNHLEFRLCLFGFELRIELIK